MTPQFKSAVETYGPRFMADLGLTRFQVSGIFGNYAVETVQFKLLQELKPTVKGSRGGWGWAQWTGPRRRAFEAWADANSFKRDDPEAFYQYTLLELRGSEKAALARLKRTTTLDTATEAFMKGYERPGVPHLDRRKAYALEALHVLEAKIAAAEAPAARSKPKTDRIAVGTNPYLPPAVASKPPSRLSAFFNILRGRPPLPTATEPAAANAPGDPTVFNVQTQLLAKGYPGVRKADGIMGPRTRDAITLIQTHNGLKPTGEITPDFLAALPGLPVRVFSTEQTEAGKRELKDQAPEVTKPLGGLFNAGWGVLGLSGLGGLKDSGLLDSAKGAADQATDTLSSVKTVVDGFVGLIQWVTAHWWVLGLAAGLYILARVGMAVLKLVVLLRQGRLL